MQKVHAKAYKHESFSFYEDDIFHLVKVMRMQIDDKLLVNFDNKRYLTKIVSIHPFLVKIEQQLNYKTNLQCNLTLIQPIIKPRHMEWIIAKAVEMQVNKIIPVFLKRSNAKNLIKHDRMQKIAYSASIQADTDNVSEISPIVSNIKSIDFNQFDLVIVPYENENNLSIDDLKLNSLKLKSIAILVGPEGGFDRKEIEYLSTINNLKIVGLTKTILRSDTASFYTIVIVVNQLLNNERK